MTSRARRDFLKTSAAAAVPFILPSGLRASSPNGRIRVGFVGMGKQSGHLLGSFIGQDDVEVVAVCDVDTTRREHALKSVQEHYAKNEIDGRKECAATNDFREVVERDDIDAVCIATPDHWHAVITTAALNAGKDVYCEKPLTHNIFESKAVIDAAQRNKRIVQTGSMQRSMKEFRVACELVRNGHIGNVERVECSFGDPGVPCDLPEEEMEPGLDWNLWLGPAHDRPYSSVLSPRGVHGHFPDWRKFREYGGGMVTDWGAHHLDIAQWGLGMDDSGPVKSLPPEDWEPLKSTRGATLVYASGIPVKHGGGIGVHFFGDEGEVQVTRGRFAFSRGGETIAQFLAREDGVSLASQLIKAENEYLGENPDVALYQSENHIRDFLDSMKSRDQPITPAETGARTAICCHLMNLAYYHGKEIAWDPKANEFAGGTGQPEWLTRDYQDGWKVT